MDSLSAIRRFVFEEGRYTLAEMGEMLRNNFEGNEIERLRLANGAPRFGNDDDYADEIAVKLFETYTAGVRRQNEKRLPKTRYVDNVFSYNMTITLGESLGATANGAPGRRSNFGLHRADAGSGYGGRDGAAQFRPEAFP